MKKETEEFIKFRKKLIHLIELRRKEIGLTQEDMEDGEWSINVRTYQRIENIETDLTLKNLFYISKKLNIQLKELFSF